MLLKNGDILLRPISLKDTDFIIELYNDLEIMSNFFSEPPLYDFKHIDWLKERENTIDLIIEFKNEKAGRIRLDNIDYKNQKCEYSVVVHRKFRRMGIARKASETLIDYVFRNLPVRKIYLHVFEENIPAINLYRKLHFEVEGVFKEEYFKNGVWKNVIRMALFKNIWVKEHRRSGDVE